jgi:hypothetical protein
MKPMGPRINTGFESTSHGLFFSYRGEKYEEHKKHIYRTYNEHQHIVVIK